MRPPLTITWMSLTENYKEIDGSNEKIKVNPVLKNDLFGKCINKWIT